MRYLITILFSVCAFFAHAQTVDSTTYRAEIADSVITTIKTEHLSNGLKNTTSTESIIRGRTEYIQEFNRKKEQFNALRDELLQLKAKLRALEGERTDTQ